MNRLEIYGVLLVLFGAILVAGYFKGRNDEKTALVTQQLADNAKALQEAADAARARAAADDAARTEAEAFTERMKQGLTDVNARFSKLPNVVMDARGCPDLNDNFRLRWNAVTGLFGASGLSPDQSGIAVPAQPVPATR